MKLSTLLAAAAGATLLVGATSALADDPSAVPNAMQGQMRSGTMGDMPLGATAGANAPLNSPEGVNPGPTWTGKAAATTAATAGVNASAVATDVPGLPTMTARGNPIVYGSSPGTYQPGTTVGMAPIPDTAANRAAYGGPESNGGKMTKAAGN